MAKKGKKNSAPQLVAPEPVADELEVDILWDAVKEVDDKPPFMDGTHLDATRALFKLEKTGRGAPDVPHNFFQLRERNLSVVRARDRFVLAEQRLKERMEVDEGLQDDDQCFLSLKQSEGEEYLRERRAAMENIAGVKSALVEDQLGLITRMEEAAEDFFRGWNDLLEEVTALATGDSKVSAAFEEKRTLTKTFREAEEQYFHDHGEHVVGIREMRRETKRQQDEMLQSMVTRLGAGVVEMARLSVEELEDKAAQQEETTRLISELMKVQGKSTVLEKQTIAINEHRATLQRLIDLEVQKQEFCILRQKQIESDLKTLSETVKHNNEQLLLLSSNAAPCQEYKKLLPMIPTSPNTISNLTNVQDKSLLLLTVEAKRQLEGLDAELKTLKDELATLRRRHIVHLSGKYKPTATDGPLSAMKKTAELGIETTSAIRSAVLNSLEQVCRCLGCTEDAEAPGDPLERLFAITDVEERKAVQLYVSRCISKLFSSECPTALPVPFPRSSEGIQWDMLPSH
ncbi:hypothetical protein, conserved [Trypanosoma brucei gambiense DAL972]|uniref:Paraflagellar rod component n=2 Tax=Trypanosoma brucei TaxID=5691 RepID=D0A6W9_TRYB9|nr:hypothetical protein, conserved [Trypanosoma brucei gambiense DAL972]RHW67192.1 paraflagellar rod component [Trypanosoma brucei equiperdum]CBH17420.1 hypothetical protein, conserved [Trypanosoma brucei gambiense DAL972]|eukprot:XP_011779684.1 hypothetical protein, conserved [Trypanosoma brucei gambiense DAL972]